jgi:hypothetical protein
MYFRILALTVSTIAAIATSCALPANAQGTVRVQHKSGPVNTYYHVRIRLADETLWLTSADRRGTLKIASGACSFERNLRRCLPYAVTLYQNGTTRRIAITSGTVYINPTNQPRHFARSSQMVPAHAVVVFFETERGTYVTVRGSLDRVEQQ